MSDEAKRLYDEGLPRITRESLCERCQDSPPNNNYRFCDRCFDFVEARNQIERQNREYLNRVVDEVRRNVRPKRSKVNAHSPASTWTFSSPDAGLAQRWSAAARDDIATGMIAVDRAHLQDVTSEIITTPWPRKTYPLELLEIEREQAELEAATKAKPVPRRRIRPMDTQDQA